MATQDVEGGMAPSGDVVDFVISIDNPFGIITPFGAMTWLLSGTIVIGPGGDEAVAGGITPTGELAVFAPVACFPTAYTCITSISPVYDCVGACDVPQLIPAQELVLGGTIIPVGTMPEECEDTPCECAPCPPLVVSECDDVLRITREKIIAWHNARCGILLSSGGDSGIAFEENFESYANIAAMEANGWAKVTTFPDPTKVAWLIDAAAGAAYEGTKSCRVNSTGSTGAGETRYRKILSLVPSANYLATCQARMPSKVWYENNVHLNIQNLYGSTHTNTYTSPAGSYKELSVTGVADGFGSMYIEMNFGPTGRVLTAYFDLIRVYGIIPNAAAEWKDLSDQGNNLVWVAGNKPTQTGVAVNGTNSLVFNDAYMVWPVDMLQDVEDLEAIVVVKSTTGSGLWRLGDDAAAPTEFPSSGGHIIENATSDEAFDFGAAVTDPTAEFVIYDVHGDAEQVLAFLGTTPQGSATSHTFGVSSAPEFGRSSVAKTGNFAVVEVILCRVLDDEERTLVITQLVNRWGLA